MRHSTIDMIYATIVLLALTLLNLPLRICATVTVNFDKLDAQIRAKSFGIRVFDELLTIDDGKLKYSGTINGTVGKMQKKDAGIGLNLLKSLHFEKIYLENCTKICTPNSVFRGAIMNTAYSILGAVTTDATHCKCTYKSLYTIYGDNTMTATIQFSVTLLSFAYTLIKEAK